MTKFLLGVAIVAFTSFCGYLLAKKYRKRKLFLSQLKEFNERFLSEISYYKRPLAEFVARSAYKGEFHGFLQKFFQSRTETDFSKLREIDFTDCEFLTPEDKRIIEDYFLMLGKGDSSSQKTYFSSAKEALGRQQSDADTAYKKYGDLYVKLGFLCGLLILILIL